MKNITKLMLATSLVAASALAGASESSAFNLKVRAGYSSAHTKSGQAAATSNATNPAFAATTGNATPTNIAQQAGRYSYAPSVKYKNGLAFEVASSYFFTPNFAVEGSLGYARAKLDFNNGYTVNNVASLGTASTTALNGNSPAQNYVSSAGTSGTLAASSPEVLKNKHVAIIPLTALAQYHLMPDNSFRPYVGLGYAYEFVTSAPKQLSVKNGGGFVGQIGADFALNDMMSFNVDLKYFMKMHHKSTDKSAKANDNSGKNVVTQLGTLGAAGAENSGSWTGYDAGTASTQTPVPANLTAPANATLKTKVSRVQVMAGVTFPF
jgi:outer membrane protein W